MILHSLGPLLPHQVTQIKLVTLELLMQAVCLCLGEDNNVQLKNVDINDPSKGKEKDFWDYAKRSILNSKLIKRIQSYKEEKIKVINPKQIEKL